jgi:Flp pilus assembly protein TadG
MSILSGGDSMRQRTAERKGAAAAELAVLLPFLMFMAIITADWARCLKMTLAANAAARNGALYASDPIYAANSPYTSTTEAALSEFTGVTPTPTVTEQSSIDAAGNKAVTVTVTVTFTTIASFPGVPTVSTLTRSCQMRIAPTATRPRF